MHGFIKRKYLNAGAGPGTPPATSPGVGPVQGINAKSRARAVIGLLMLMAVAMPALPSAAEQTPFSGTAGIRENLNEAAARALVDDLGKTLSESLRAERENLAVYRGRLARANRERLFLAAAVNGYQLQLSTYGNLLLSTGVDMAVRQKTSADLRSSLLELQKITEDLAPTMEALGSERQNLDQQKSLVSKQIKELARINIRNKGNKATLAFAKTARELSAVLNKKEAQVLRLDKIYQTHVNSITDLKAAFVVLAEKYDTAIARQKSQDLFERRTALFRIKALKLLGQEAGDLIQWAEQFSQPGFWGKWLLRFWQSAGLVAISFILVPAFALIALGRIKTALAGLGQLPLVQQLGHWHGLAADLACRSVIPAGLTAVVLLYSRLDAMYLIARALEMAAMVFMAVLVFRWTGTAVSRIPKTDGRIPGPALWMETVFKGAALFSLFYYLPCIILGPAAGSLAVLRMTGASWLIIFSLRRWQRVRSTSIAEAVSPKQRRAVILQLGLKYTLVGTGSVALAMDMTGYGSLAAHWMISWGKTAMILFWGGILFAMFREWDQLYREKATSKRNELLYDDYPVQWLMIRAGQFAWVISLIISLLLVWGNRETVLGRIYGMLAHPLVLGNMTFSLMGALYAVLVLVMTYALTRIWRWVFQSKFLNRSGMEAGLQDSITTITVYVIWIFGILLSLHMFGLNTASLAVAFGALGIGLGFGLQNIFNNFISGIILLFERPIQVGDDVEINGTWAQVKKINVRSTVVQTYDNASLIIPNADFISSKVTNWSFKDKRIRRNIEVGVAYGSDTGLVKKTLLEIAENTPRVLAYPQPDVWFRDFGDSALIFRLRIWTDIYNMLSVETDIRFSIDRLFRERGIEISFPQRDIHIRTTLDNRSENTAGTGHE